MVVIWIERIASTQDRPFCETRFAEFVMPAIAVVLLLPGEDAACGMSHVAQSGNEASPSEGDLPFYSVMGRPILKRHPVAFTR